MLSYPAAIPLPSAHTRIRAIGERANATLKGWKVLTKLRRCPRQATAIEPLRAG